MFNKGDRVMLKRRFLGLPQGTEGAVDGSISAPDGKILVFVFFDDINEDESIAVPGSFFAVRAVTMSHECEARSYRETSLPFMRRVPAAWSYSREFYC